MLISALIESATRSRRALAVSDGTRSLNYGQLVRLAVVFRQIFRRECANEPVVGFLLPASSLFPPAFFGALWASKIAIPLNFLLQPEEVSRIIADAGLKTVVSIRHFQKSISLWPVRSLFLEDLSLPYRAILSTLRSRPPFPTTSPDETAVILYTSGTSAQPKGVELTYGNLYHNCVDTIATLDIDPRQLFLNVLPPFHVFGLTANVLIPVVLGAAVRAVPRFSPLGVARIVRADKVTIMLAVPSMYAAMLRLKSIGSDVFRSVFLAVSGGEPLPDTVREGFEKRFQITLHEGYGLTETSPVVSVCTQKSYRPGTVGKPIRNVELRIIDQDGHAIGPGCDGEILVRGPGVMKGYYQKTEETQAVIDAEGWFHTGDIGRRDADGFLSITGRAKEMLIVAGENVFPREIEAVLEQHGDVLQAAVVGTTDGLRGQVPVAFVIPRKDSGVSPEQLRQFVRKSLPGFKTPRRVEIRDDLPIGPTGKILKRQLHEFL